MRFRNVIAVATALLLIVGPAAACRKNQLHRRAAQMSATVWQMLLTRGVEWPPSKLRSRPKPAAKRDVDLGPYRGVAAWVD
ncbi:MAG: hypothetical protein ACRD1T_23430, partial [Acidimicrobiia bacterium]